MIVILTGAGISQESGLATFRDQGGLWENERIEDVATPEAFMKSPMKVHSFYNKRRKQLLSNSICPNNAHVALAKLERECPCQLLVVTQNVDNLHERAGSHHLLHMHGELFKVRCSRCGGIYHWEFDLSTEDVCPLCHAKGHLRPHIVWFGEMPLYMDTIQSALTSCCTFVSIGTSANVYPASAFLNIAKRSGAKTIEINLEPSVQATLFDEAMYGYASELVPKWVDKTLSYF